MSGEYMSLGVYVLGGMCPWHKPLKLKESFLLCCKCPGGKCPGGICPCSGVC